jgi:hypothetical protein
VLKNGGSYTSKPAAGLLASAEYARNNGWFWPISVQYSDSLGAEALQAVAQQFSTVNRIQVVLTGSKPESTCAQFIQRASTKPSQLRQTVARLGVSWPPGYRL